MERKQLRLGFELGSFSPFAYNNNYASLCRCHLVGWSCRIHRLHRDKITPTTNKDPCWPLLVPFNAWGGDLRGRAFLPTKGIKWLGTLHFSPFCARRAVGETQFHQTAGHIKRKLQYDCPGCILQIALVAPKYIKLFYLKDARWRWQRVNYAEIAILEIM